MPVYKRKVGSYNGLLSLSSIIGKHVLLVGIKLDKLSQYLHNEIVEIKFCQTCICIILYNI